MGEGDDTGNPFRYTGRRLDPETGLYYYRARYYSPGIGRFLQTDPIGYGDGLNWYAYVGNDPLNKTDPSGEFGLIGALIGAAIELAVQVKNKEFGLNAKSLGKIAVSAAVGAVTGGVGNVVKAAQGLSVAAKVATTSFVGASYNAVGTTVKGAIDGEVSVGEVVESTATGGLGNGVSTVAGPVVGEVVSNAGEIADTVLDTTEALLNGKGTFDGIDTYGQELFKDVNSLDQNDLCQTGEPC